MLTYTSWLVYEAVMMVPVIRVTKSRFLDEIIDIAILMVFDYLPILIVLTAHFMSYSSVGRLLKIVMTLK